MKVGKVFRWIAPSAAALAACAALPITGTARAETQACGVSVSIRNVQEQTGAIYASIHTAEAWGRQPTATTRVAVQDDHPQLCFNVAPGRYAIRLFHDRNGDGKLGTNLMGIPNEPFGFSNDAPVQFGPPAFEAAAFDVGATGISITVSLH